MMRQIFSAIAIMVAVVGLAYGGPMITGSGGGSTDTSGLMTLISSASTDSFPQIVGSGGSLKSSAYAPSYFATAAHLHANVYLAAASNADTATALAANPANCAAGYYALGITASGSAEGCAVATTAASVVGSSASGDVMANLNGIPGPSGLTTDGTNVTLPGVLVVGMPTQEGSKGFHVLVTAGSTLEAGAVIYDSQSAVYASHTSSIYMKPYPLLTVEACNNGSTTCKALRFGYYRYAGVQGWSPGQTLYVASGYGSITATAPTVTNYQLQIIGYAVDSITAWFQPSPTIIQLTN